MTGPADLTAALRAHTQGLYCLQAAVELVAAARRLPPFRPHRPGLIDRTQMALSHWPEAVAALHRGQLPCSGGEGRLLRLGASLAEGIPVDLRDTLTGLDTSNAELVSRAVKHATGNW